MSAITKLAYDVYQKNIPYTVFLELTRRCNLNCQHCYATPERGRRELRFEDTKHLIDELRELGTLFILFTGGDPTVNPNFLNILCYASDKKMAIQLFTNGLAITNEVIDELAKLKIFYIGVSVYGATAKTHDTVTRVPGSFEKTINACKRLKEKGIYVIFKYVITHLNFHEYDMMIEQAERLGILYKMNAKITARDDMNFDTQNLSLDRENMKMFFVNQLETHFPDKIVNNENLRDMACTMGRSMIAINAYGDVFPCVTVPIPAGNVRYASLKEIWHNSPFLKEVRRFPDKEKIHGCTTCGIRKYCNRCPGNTFTETGDIYGPSPSACREALLWKEVAEEKEGRPHEQVELPPGLRGVQAIDDSDRKPITWDRFSYFKTGAYDEKEPPFAVSHIGGWEPYEIVHGAGSSSGGCSQASKSCGKDTPLSAHKREKADIDAVPVEWAKI